MLVRPFFPNFAFELRAQVAEQTISLGKRMGYPGPLSKSSFQTLGTRQSWPQALGFLHYLAGRLRAKLAREAKVKQLVFGHKGFEDEGEPDGQISFQQWAKCYAAFNQGRDDFQPELNELEQKLEANHGASKEAVKALQKERAELERQLEALESVPRK